MIKTIIALLPAAIVMVGLNSITKDGIALDGIMLDGVTSMVEKSEIDSVIWFWLMIILLIVGGFLSAYFVTSFLIRRKPGYEIGFVILGFLIFATYIATFSLTGCWMVMKDTWT